jgi:hypothetical protein
MVVAPAIAALHPFATSAKALIDSGHFAEANCRNASWGRPLSNAPLIKVDYPLPTGRVGGLNYPSLLGTEPRWRVALLAMPPPLDLGPFAEIAPHGTREGLDEAGVLAAIPRRGGGGSGHQSGSRRRGRRQEGPGAVEALAMLFWNRQVGFPWSPE